MKKTIMLAFVAANAAVLAGCGGGNGPSSSATAGTSSGTVGTNPGNEQVVIGNSGSVSAPFVKGSAPRYLVLTSRTANTAPLTTFTQAPNGAITNLAAYTLTGETAVQNISGDANFAVGRWVKGTVAYLRRDFDGTSNEAVHYVLYNPPKALPVSGNFTCDAGRYTVPSAYSDNSNHAPSAFGGTTIGSAKLSFSAAGAAIGVTLNTTAGGQTGTLTGDLTLVKADSARSTDGFNPFPGLLLTVGDGGGGKVLVLVGYLNHLAKDMDYQGIAVFSCSP